MTNAMQRTFGETVGLDPIVPTISHPTNMVTCEDTGEYKVLRDCFLAADGNFFADESERFDHEVELVREYLESCIKWDDEYRKSDDCADDYHFLVGEDSSTLSGIVIEWADSHTDSDSTNFPEAMREAVCGDILEQMEVKVLHGYSTYGSPDVVLGDYECGETEVQVDIADNDILKALANRDDLEGILEELEDDFCISGTHKPIKVDGKIVRWEHDRYVSGGCFTLMNNTDIRYVFGLSDESLVDIWEEHAEKVDCRLYRVDGKYSAELFFNVSDDFDSEWICDKVAKRHKSNSATFVNHHDYASETVAEHRELLMGLFDILSDTGSEYPTTPGSNAIIASWAEEALSDAEIDFSDRYPGKEYS